MLNNNSIKNKSKNKSNNNSYNNNSNSNSNSNNNTNNNINAVNSIGNRMKRNRLKKGNVYGNRFSVNELKDDDYVKLKIEKAKTGGKGYKVTVMTSYSKYNGSYDIFGKFVKGFGGRIMYRGNNEEPTLSDFLNRWEQDYGVTAGKSGSFRSDKQQTTLSSMVSDNVTMNTKLKDLVNESIEWLNFKPNMMELENVDTPLNVDINQKADAVVNLTKLFKNNKDEFTKMEWCLSNRGWVLCEFPKNMWYKITTPSKLIYNAFNDKDILKEFKMLCDSFGYIKYKDYKTLFRILTQDMLPIFENEYPKEILDSIYLISETMQILSNQLMTNKIFSPYIKNNNELSGVKGLPLTNNKTVHFGMIDYVLYDNNKIQDNDEYKMLNDDINVESHVDPGLFSLSFLQTQKGLQLYDKCNKQWFDVNTYKDGKTGVIWLGKYAETITNNKYKSGIHRVIYNDKKPRFTGWFESCINKQILNKVIQSASK